MDLIEFGRLTQEYRAQLEGDESDPFDAEGATLSYRLKDRHVALRDEDGRLVASAGMLVTEVEINGPRFPVVGLGGVIVNAAFRGRGLGRCVVEAALGRARTMGPAFVILFCHPDRTGLYERLGFTDVDSAVSVKQPHGFAAMPQCSMWQALRPEAAWPTGPVVIHSLPF